MSNEEQETIADIVREMRIGDLCANDTTTSMVYINDFLAGYADRIEAAAKREREATPEKSSVVANAMKMREALRGLLEIVCVDCKSSYEIDGKCVKCPRVVAAEAALSAPPRNCDLGTAEEQHARFYSFCDKIEECKKCPLWRGGGLTSKCSVYWAQLPYEEGAEDEGK